MTFELLPDSIKPPAPCLFWVYRQRWTGPKHVATEWGRESVLDAVIYASRGCPVMLSDVRPPRAVMDDRFAHNVKVSKMLGDIEHDALPKAEAAYRQQYGDGADIRGAVHELQGYAQPLLDKQNLVDAVDINITMILARVMPAMEGEGLPKRERVCTYSWRRTGLKKYVTPRVIDVTWNLKIKRRTS